MNASAALTLRLLLVVATASLGSCLGDQCSVVHYLAAGETRDFSFRSGNQFVDNLHCIFSFSAPSDHHLTVAVTDLDMAPPTAGLNDKTSCVDDVLTIYDLTGGQLQATGSYCGNNSTLNPEFVLSSNIAVVSFVSHESSTPRRFTLALKTVQQMEQVQQNGSNSEGQKEVETGPGEGQGNGEEGQGNGEEEGAGEEETVTETGEGEEETVTETADGEGEEESEEGDEEEGNEDEEASGDNRRQSKAVPKISALTPRQRSASASIQKRARREQNDGHNATYKPREKRIKQKKHQTAHTKAPTVRAHPVHNKTRQADKVDGPLQLRQHTPQPFGKRIRANGQLQLQPRRHTLQLQRRRHSLQPTGNSFHQKSKHNKVQQKRELRDTIK